MRKAILAGVLAGLCAVSAAGCRREEPPVFEPTAHHTAPLRTKASDEQTGTAETTETTDAPRDPELDARLEALYAAEPVPIPEGGWTDETLIPVTLICGKPAETPFCLKDLLYGYSFYEEGNSYYEAYPEHFFSRQIMLNSGFCTLTDLSADETVPADVMPETKNLKLYADWLVVTPDGGQRYPVSINCVTIGSTADEVKELIGELRQMPDVDGNVNEDGFFRAECSTESWRVIITGSQKTVSTIFIYDRKQGSDPSGK